MNSLEALQFSSTVLRTISRFEGGGWAERICLAFLPKVSRTPCYTVSADHEASDSVDRPQTQQTPFVCDARHIAKNQAHLKHTRSA